MFTSYPTYSRYRTLHLTTPNMQGEDVYALQTALSQVAFGLTLDGVLGPKTSSAISSAQSILGITSDGLAGGATQEALARRLGSLYSDTQKVPNTLVRGQMEHESSDRLGNYSVQYPDGSYDAGVVQRNTKFTLPIDGFNVPRSIEALCAHTRTYYSKFLGVGENRRRWGLAAGAWNAPAFACYLAKEEGATGVKTAETAKPTSDQRATLEAYITDVSVYL